MVTRRKQSKGRARAEQSSDGTRRTEILDMAAKLFGTSGFQTSLNEIADACGIKAGSLYHHFDSKEAIVIELIERYQIELDGVANEALNDLQQEKAKPAFKRITALADAIVSCASNHRAALLQTFYDPPASASEKFTSLARRTSATIEKAMLEILRSASKTGYIRSGVDLARLSEHICQSMLHTSVGIYHLTPGAEKMPELKCQMIFEGLATNPPSNEKLSKSKAFVAAENSIAKWQKTELAGDKSAKLWAAARGEFGRRGYEATTIRDIAAAADMSTGAVYRVVGSKEELLVSIMTTFISHVNDGWNAVIASKSTPVEKLDALMWFDINVLSHFSDEFKIQLAWLRQSPPDTTNFGEFTDVVKQVTAVMIEGERSGAFRKFGSSASVRAHSLLELVWVPENIVRSAGVSAAHALARDTLLRGVANPAAD